MKPKGDDAYAKASRKAMNAYAFEIRKTNPDLSNQLQEWVKREYFDKDQWKDQEK